MIFVGKREGKRPLGRPRHRWKNNIKCDPQEVGWGRKDWIDVTQGQVVGCCACGNEPSDAIKCGEFFD